MSISTTLTLEEVTHHFKAWRSAKGRDKKIPPSLWQQVNSLRGHYKSSIIGRTLGISTAQMRKQFPEHYAQPKPKKDLPTFMNIPIAPILTTSSVQHPPTLTLERPNGVKLTLSHWTCEQLLQVFHQFVIS